MSISSGVHMNSAVNTLTTSGTNQISNTAMATLGAGQTVFLEPGFDAVPAIGGRIFIRTAFCDTTGSTVLVAKQNENQKSGYSINSLSVFPNPTSATVNLSFNVTDPAMNAIIEVFDMNLLKVKEMSLGSLASGKQSVTMNLSGLSPALYTIVVRSQNIFLTAKVVSDPVTHLNKCRRRKVPKNFYFWCIEKLNSFKMKSHFKPFLLVFFLLNYSSSFCQQVDSSQIELQQEKQFWDRVLTKDTSYHFNKQPNAFLAENIKGRKPGKALDIAMGQGRNTIFLAQQGWDVTGFDIADSAVAFAQARAEMLGVKINTVLIDEAHFDYGINKWDLIACIYAGCMDDDPGIPDKIKQSLKPGGILVFEFFHRDAGIAMGRPDFGCEANQVKNYFANSPGFKILTYEEKMGMADYGLDSEKLVYMVVEKEK